MTATAVCSLLDDDERSSAIIVVAIWVYTQLEILRLCCWLTVAICVWCLLQKAYYIRLQLRIFSNIMMRAIATFNEWHFFLRLLLAAFCWVGKSNAHSIQYAYSMYSFYGTLTMIPLHLGLCWNIFHGRVLLPHQRTETDNKRLTLYLNTHEPHWIILL